MHFKMPAAIQSFPVSTRGHAVVARANRVEKLVQLVGSGVAAAAPALAASSPTFEELSKLSYGTATKSIPAAAPLVSSAATAATDLDLSAVGDAGPLVGGLAVGIVVVGAALKAVVGSTGPTTTVRIVSSSSL